MNYYKVCDGWNYVFEGEVWEKGSRVEYSLYVVGAVMLKWLE